MKATIVLIADDEAENYGRKLMLRAHRAGGMGFEMARLPQHVSLKQPFVIPDLDQMEEFFDSFAKKLKPVDIDFVGIQMFPSVVLGGMKSGVMMLEAKSSPELIDAQKKLNEGLVELFGPCPAEHDDDYMFHMTFAIGGADYDSYQKAYDALIKDDYNKSFKYIRLGLLYYDDDNIVPGSYFCYKICELNK